MAAGHFITKFPYFGWDMFHILVEECVGFVIIKATLVFY